MGGGLIVGILLFALLVYGLMTGFSDGRDEDGNFK